MVCLLHHGEGRQIRGWVIATDLADLRRQVQGRIAFDPQLNDIAQAIYVLEGGFPAPQGQRELLGGRYSILFD